MTLSVCCPTDEPGARVAAVLGQLRHVADEIVVAVDSRLDPHRLGRYADVADRLLRYEFVNTVEQAIPFLAAQCTGDWILRVDGDEVISPAVIERLSELTGASDVFQYWLPCRWTFPDAEHYIAQPPWHFSAPRLVRNDPATLWHPGVSHSRFDPVFPSVHLEDGFYHLSLLIHDPAYREAKVARCLELERAHDRRGLEIDVSAFYVPERDQRFAVEPVPIPARDRLAVADVLAASGEELPGPPANEVRLATWTEIQRVWPRRAFPETAYRGTIEAFEPSPVLLEGEQRPITLRITNRGHELWPGSSREPWIKLTHRWVHEDGPLEPTTCGDTCLPARLAPGASALVPVLVEAPQNTGRYLLEFDLVHVDLLLGRVIKTFGCPTRIATTVEAAEWNPGERPSGADRNDRAPGSPADRHRRSGGGRRRPSRVALPQLTFDDGPSEWTEPLLEVLRTYSAPATFFVIGHKARQRPDLVQAAAWEGHEIANHTEDHAPLTRLGDDAEILRRLESTSDLIGELIGRRPRSFRPPWGLTNERIEQLAASLGMKQVLWTKDPHDYDLPGADRIAAIIQEAQESDIVLLHDGRHAGPGDRHQTVEGVRRALAALTEGDYPPSA